MQKSIYNKCVNLLKQYNYLYGSNRPEILACLSLAISIFTAIFDSWEAARTKFDDGVEFLFFQLPNRDLTFLPISTVL